MDNSISNCESETIQKNVGFNVDSPCRPNCKRVPENSSKVYRDNLIEINIDRPMPTTKIFNQDTLKIALQNVRYAGGKSAAIVDNIKSLNSGILVLNETWHEPKDKAILNSITPAGYSCIDRARPVPRGVDVGSAF